MDLSTSDFKIKKIFFTLCINGLNQPLVQFIDEIIFFNHGTNGFINIRFQNKTIIFTLGINGLNQCLVKFIDEIIFFNFGIDGLNLHLP